MALATAPLMAQLRPNTTGKPVGGRMVDARVNLPDSAKAAMGRPWAELARQDGLRIGEEIAAAASTLRQARPTIEVEISAATLAPSSVANGAYPLTDAASGLGNEEVVRGYLRAHADLYGLTNADLADLVVLGDSDGGSSGVRTLRMEQQIDGRPIFQSETRFILDKQSRLWKSVGLLVPHAREQASRIAGAAWMSPAQAVVRLLASEGKSSSAAAFQQVASGEGGRLELSTNDAAVKGAITARQVLFPLAPGVLVPAWSLVVFTTGDHDWYAMVDAETGSVLWRKNIRNYASTHEARFRVYVQADGKTPADSPAPASPNVAVPGANTQFPEIAPTIVNMSVVQDIAASPNGWIDDCPGGVCAAAQTQTLGNNVLACIDLGGTADVCDTAAAGVIDGNGRPIGNPDANARNRDFLGTAPRDFQTNYLPPPQAGNPEAGQTCTGNGNNGTLAIDQFRRGMITQLFYVSNWYHDQLFALGFNEAAGNFQLTNFSGMGTGGDRVLADGDDGSGTNNANFSTPPDGTSGRMQMYRFTGPTIDRDGSLDTVIVIHELTHGTSNRLVGNAAGLNWDPAVGMGEGWSDFYAQSLLNNTNADTPGGQYPAGAYGTYKLGGLQDNYVYAIRRFPNHTNNAVNPLTWADADESTANMSGGIAPSPLGFQFNGGMEVHNAGEIWANTLWEVRDRIIADPAGANGSVPTGNLTALQIVTNGLKLTPIDPGFIEARDAILQADCVSNACANEDSIWGGFADRGLGYGAAMPYRNIFGYISSHLALHESTSLPYLDMVDQGTDLIFADPLPFGNANGAIDNGETFTLQVELTNPWRRATRTATAITATLSTSTPGVTITDATAAYPDLGPTLSSFGTGADSFTVVVSQASPPACGSMIDFTITVTSSLGTTIDTFQLRMGLQSGTGVPIILTDDPNPNLTITDQRGAGILRSFAVATDVVIADLDLRIDSVTHAWSGDLAIALYPPVGAEPPGVKVGSDLVSLIGFAVNPSGGGNSGDNPTNMVVDDDVANNAANDMVQAANAAAPFTKSWQPPFNSPWPALFGLAPDPVSHLSRFNGLRTLGTWTLVASDQAAPDVGTLNAWSLIVTPAIFSCAQLPVELIDVGVD